MPLSEDFDPGRMAWVFTPDELSRLEAVLAGAGEVTFDLETTGLHEHAVTDGPVNQGIAARVVLASFTIEAADGDGDTWVLPLSHPESPWRGTWRTVLRRAAQALATAGVALVGHNVKYDVKWVHATTGVDLSPLIVWDTQMSSHLVDENASTRLKERAPATFGIDAWDENDLTAPGAAERVPLFDLGTYGARDTYWSWRLAQAHREEMWLGPEVYDPPVTPEDVEMARLGRLAVWEAMPAVSTLAAIEQRGIGLDTDWVRATTATDSAKRDRLFKKMANRYPPLDPARASFAPTSTWFREWADLAVAAGDLQVAALTPTGKPQWTRQVLFRQAANGSEVAADLLEYRRLVKRIEYLSSWLMLVTPADTIHTTYNAGRVVTGRLSSDTPNMQQITSALRPAFVPRPGFVFADLDYSQIELRVAAYVSRCEPMIEAFQRGDDLHRLLAARITHKDPADVTPEERQKGKSANFGLLYGMSSIGFRLYAEDAYGVVMSQDEADAVHRAFFDTWPQIAEWHARTAARLAQTGQVVSPIGRVRRLPEVWSSNDATVAGAERAAVNSPVQGFASDLMQIAAASIEGRLPGSTAVDGARIVATVHDSIVIEVAEQSWETVAVECAERMRTVPDLLVRQRLLESFDVPLEVEGKVGSRWGLSDIGSV